MHYGDSEAWQKANKIVMVVYNHDVLGEPDADQMWVLNSIQECQYISPFDLQKLLCAFEYMFAEELKGHKESWYKLEIHQDGEMNFILDSMEEIIVTADTNEFLTLH